MSGNSVAEALRGSDVETAVAVSPGGDDFKAAVAEALRFYGNRLAESERIQRLRDLWRERKISEDDPVWLVAEVLSDLEGRAQIGLSRFLKVIEAYDRLTQASVAEMREMVKAVHKLEIDLATSNKKMDTTIVQVEQMGLHSKRFVVVLPELLESMRKAQQVLDTGRRQARLELMGMIAGAMVVGAFLAILITWIVVFRATH